MSYKQHCLNASSRAVARVALGEQLSHVFAFGCAGQDADGDGFEHGDVLFVDDTDFGGALSRGLHGGLAAYARDVFRAFEQGASPDDFSREDYERSWVERFAVESLNSLGRAGLGLE
ncbi:CdiI_2 domain-containing protein [Pseudomonas sp. IT-93MI4]